MKKVITYRGAYTAHELSLCARHANDDDAGMPLGPVQHGAHWGTCDVCIAMIHGDGRTLAAKAAASAI